MSHVLESGQYYITSADGGSPIGRKPEEDSNNVPKGIYKLAEGTESVWDVEKLDNGNYKLTNKSAIVGGIVGLVFAFPAPNQAAAATTEWAFEFYERMAQDGYYVIRVGGVPSNQALPWSVPAPSVEANPQVILSPLIVNPTIPPTYPLNAVFFFKKVDA